MGQNVPLLLLALLVIGVYVLPSIVATFAGSHTTEFNASVYVKGLQCPDCHEYIWDELSLTDESRNVLQAHRNAAGNGSKVGNYTTNWLSMDLDNTTNSSLCYFCHIVQINTSTGEPLTPTHTQILVRVCTDLDCHGNNESTDNTAYDAGDIGPDLGNKNAHERWFDGMSKYGSTYKNETGANYTKGYWACLGCHTYVEMNINATEDAYLHDDAGAEQRRYL